MPALDEKIIREQLSTHLQDSKSTPLHEVGQCTGHVGTKRTSQKVLKRGVDKFRSTHKGLINQDLIPDLAQNQSQAHDILKYYHETDILFTPGDLLKEGISIIRNGINIIRNTSPQQYFPTCIKSEVIQKLNEKSTPLNPTGVMSTNFGSNYNVFLDFVLPQLPQAPLKVHNLHFKTTIPPKEYWELKEYKSHEGNKGRSYRGKIERANVNYKLYQNGTVDVQASCSSSPFRVQTDSDRFKLIGLLTQLQGGLANIVSDSHSGIVKDVTGWQVTECEFNKDVKVSHWLQVFPIKIQVKHLDHMFSTYIKSLGANTVCRVEEKKRFPDGVSVLEFIADVLNPQEKLLKEIDRLNRKLDFFFSMNYNSRPRTEAHYNN